MLAGHPGEVYKGLVVFRVIEMTLQMTKTTTNKTTSNSSFSIEETAVPNVSTGCHSSSFSPNAATPKQSCLSAYLIMSPICH